MKLGGGPRLFKGADGYGDGEQKRDFIYVKDVAKINLWFLDNPVANGIYNCGTGKAHTFNEVGKTMIDAMGSKMKISYCEFPTNCAANIKVSPRRTRKNLRRRVTKAASRILSRRSKNTFNFWRPADIINYESGIKNAD